jgi:ribosomal protein L37AE/L43A
VDADGLHCCPDCPHKLKTRRGIELHLRDRHATPPVNKKHAIKKLAGAFRCTVCGTESPSYKVARRHELEHH